MGLMQKIQDDVKTAMKAQDKVRTGVLRMVLSDLKYAKAENSMAEELPDADALKVVQGYLKKLEKSLADYPEGDARKAIQDEMAIVAEYVPKKASREDVEAAIAKVLGATADRNFGALMKLVTAELGAGADGKVISEVLKAKLA